MRNVRIVVARVGDSDTVSCTRRCGGAAVARVGDKLACQAHDAREVIADMADRTVRGEKSSRARRRGGGVRIADGAASGVLSSRGEDVVRIVARLVVVHRAAVLVRGENTPRARRRGGSMRVAGNLASDVLSSRETYVVCIVARRVVARRAKALVLNNRCAARAVKTPAGAAKTVARSRALPLPESAILWPMTACVLLALDTVSHALNNWVFARAIALMFPGNPRRAVPVEETMRSISPKYGKDPTLPMLSLFTSCRK
jgi:hypothetical protein